MFDKFDKLIFKKFQPVRDVEAAGTLWEDEWAFSAWLGGDALLSRLLKKSSASAASSGSPKKNNKFFVILNDDNKKKGHYPKNHWSLLELKTKF